MKGKGRRQRLEGRRAKVEGKAAASSLDPPTPTRLTGDEDENTLAELRDSLDEAKRQRDAGSAPAKQRIVSDLARVGIVVSSVWDLVNTSLPYQDAIPVLVRHLEEDHPDRVLEGVARALAVKDARPYWPIIEKAYKRRQDPTALGAKAGMALALSVIADEDVLDSLIALLRDSRNGESRVFLVAPLGRIRHASAIDMLEELEIDPLFAREARAARRRLERSLVRGPRAERNIH